MGINGSIAIVHRNIYRDIFNKRILPCLCSCSLWSIASMGINGSIAIVHRNIYRDIFNKRILPCLCSCSLWSISRIRINSSIAIVHRNIYRDIFNKCILPFLCSCSLWSIASIGVNRYIAIVHRNIYRDIFNKRTLPFLLITLWSICFFIDLPNLTGWGAHTFDPKLMLCTYNYAESYSYTFFFIVVGFGIPLAALIYSYARIVMYARATKAEVAAISKSDNSKSSVANQAIRNNDLRLLRSVLTIVVVFFIMWTPYATIVVFDRYATWSRTPHVIAVVMAHMNSCINSIIYGATNKNFRQAYGRLLVTLFTCGRRRDLESKSIMSNSSASTTPSNA
nr:melatonin receptor type 1A-like [Lytechinus pictus]